MSCSSCSPPILAALPALLAAAVCSIPGTGAAQTDNATRASDIADAGHREQNEVYSWLREGTASEVFGSAIRLPPPTMPDGLTKAEQAAVIAEVSRPRYTPERLLSASVSAPHVLRIEHQPLDPSDPRSTVINRMTLYFTVAASLEAVSDPEFLNQIFELREEEAGRTTVPARQLRAAGIEPPDDDERREYYTPIETTLFDRIELRGVGHSRWSRTEDSILSALHVDQRFSGEPVLAARWRRFERQDDGTMEPVETGDFPGAGVYVKITRLRGTPGKLFVEAHGVLLEPYSWFRGRSLIVSKLPPAIRSEVHAIRRRALRASRDRN